jgi:hypothetical protein
MSTSSWIDSILCWAIFTKNEIVLAIEAYVPIREMAYLLRSVCKKQQCLLPVIIYFIA